MQYASRLFLQTNHLKHLKKNNKQKILTKLIDGHAIKNWRIIGVFKLVSLAIAKGNCMIKGFKMESETSLLPSNVRR